MSPRRRMEPEPREESRLRALAVSLLRVAVAIAALGALGLIGWDGYRYLTTAERFSLKEVKVAGCDEERAGEVRRQARVQEGQNLWSFSASAMAERIGRLPWVEAARVEKILPDRLAITVQERRPVARMEHPQQGWVGMDGQGILFSLREWEMAGLPVVEGLDQGVFRFGARVGAECHDEVLELLVALHEAGPETVARFPLLSLESDGDVLFRGLDFADEVRLGRRGLVEAWRRLEARLPQMLALCPRYDYLDLRFPGQGIVARPRHYEPRSWLYLAQRLTPPERPAWRTEMAESGR